MSSFIYNLVQYDEAVALLLCYYSYYFAAKTLSCWSLLDAQRVFYKEKIIN